MKTCDIWLIFLFVFLVHNCWFLSHLVIFLFVMNIFELQSLELNLSTLMPGSYIIQGSVAIRHQEHAVLL